MQAGQHHRSGDPRPHGAAADDASAGDVAGGDTFDLWHFGHGAFGKEGVHHAGPLRRVQHRQEQAAFCGRGVLVGQFGASNDGVQDGQRGDLAFGGFGQAGAPIRQQRSVCGREWQVGHGAGASAICNQLRCIGQRVGAQIVPRQRIDKAHIKRLRAADRATAGHQGQGGVQTHKARHPLRAASARDHAKGDFGQAQLGGLGRDAVMRAQCNL